MNLPKPLKTVLTVLLMYAVCVLLLHYRRDGMDWTLALLLGLALAPVALLLSWGRERLNSKAERAGLRLRERRARNQ
ncbi:hypothetical protein DMA15_35645 [Streptomyces sp. WAC 01529]|uniref:hypothetical protein n=1 Tax=Streptomyces sp. WAC 01529 TaxID=2203205 RepID=UPI000F71B700|nr:hypothetical protein [Streptomyces sp. WAC 01529]AZM57236.1 hypothetical protein DMA15_35645 [Streptomyces sp. WAC 01529]